MLPAASCSSTETALAFDEVLDPDVSPAVLEGGGDLDAGVAEVAQRDVVLLTTIRLMSR